MSNPLDNNFATSNDVRYEVDENGVLVQIVQGAAGGQHLKFIYDVPGLQTPNRHLHRQPIPQNPPAPAIPMEDDGIDTPMADPARTNARFVTPPMPPHAVPRNVPNTPRRVPPLQASPRMVDRVAQMDTDSDSHWSEFVPTGRARMEREAEMIRRQVERKHADRDRWIFWQQKIKMEKRRDEVRRAMEFDVTGMMARPTSDVHNRNLTPSDSTHSSDFSSANFSTASTERSSVVVERAITVVPSEVDSRDGSPTYYSSGPEDRFSTPDANVYEWVDRDAMDTWEFELDDRSRATTPDIQSSSPRDNVSGTPYQPYQVVNLPQAASHRDEQYDSDNSSLSALTELDSESDDHSTTGSGRDPERYTGDFFGQRRSRDARDGGVIRADMINDEPEPVTRSSVKTPRKVKKEAIELTVLTRSRAKARRNNA